MTNKPKKEVLLLLPEPPRTLRESGISIRYIPLIESLYNNCIIDAIVISKENYTQDSLSLLKKYCRNVNAITHQHQKDISLINKIVTRFKFFLPWSFPRSWITYSKEYVENLLIDKTHNIKYDTLICVSGYNYPFVSVINAGKIVVDFIDSPTVLSWRNVIGSNRNYLVRLYECFKTFVWEARIIRNTDATIYISSFDVETIPNFIASRTKRHVIRNGYCADDYTSSIVESIQHPSIGFLGNMSYFPNVEAVKWLHDNVFIKLKLKLPNIKFYIIGRSPADEILELGETPDVVVTGNVESIWSYLNAIDIMVFPLLRGAGVKNKILEAMYANRLVITTKIGDEGIDAARDGALILCRSSDEYIDIIERYLDSSEDRNKIATKGREFVVKNFSWNVIQDKFKKLILE